MKIESAIFLVLAMVLLICLSGCATMTPRESPAGPEITRQPQITVLPTAPARTGPYGVTWHLVSFSVNNSVREVIPGTSITAYFNGFSTVTGSSGCNQYTASYTSSQNQLSIGTPASTRMFCESPQGTMDQESSYLAAIQRASSFTVEGTTLSITDLSGNKVLTFTALPLGPQAPVPLTGTSWYLESYVDPAGTTWSPGRLTVVSLMLTDDGKVYGNAGCNDYLGVYGVTGDQISVTGISQNRRYCGVAGVMELESTYLTMLPQMTRYSLSGDLLRLSDPKTGTSILFDTKPNLP